MIQNIQNKLMPLKTNKGNYHVSLCRTCYETQDDNRKAYVGYDNMATVIRQIKHKLCRKETLNGFVNRKTTNYNLSTNYTMLDYI
jgi:heterodisulfide reductase subunit B